MLRVSVVTVYDADMRVPFPMSKIQYVRNAVNTFIAWPTHLVKPLSDVSKLIFPMLVFIEIDIVDAFFIT